MPKGTTNGDETSRTRQRPLHRRARAGGPPVITTSGITVQFGGVVANSDIHFSLHEKRITALIGPNGAGKTTLFNVLTGAVQPSSGTVTIEGQNFTALSPGSAVRCGIARTFQNLNLVDSLTLLDNVVVGRAASWRTSLPEVLIGSRRSRAEDGAARDAARHAINCVGLAGFEHIPVGTLPYGLQRRAEIARAIAASPRMLLLDEPSAGMGPSETAELGDLIAWLVDELEMTVLVVEHDMSMVKEFADYVYVLHLGEVLTHGDPREVLSDQRVKDVYLGSQAVAQDA